MEFVEDQLEAFKRSLQSPLDPDDRGGKHARTFGAGLPDVDADRLPNGLLMRSEVLSLVNDPSVNTPTVAAAIMAWGGMQINFRDMLFKSAERQWLNVSGALRLGEIDRKAAYAQFRALRYEDRLKGAGPAYFTKLIYFLTSQGQRHAPQGFIMDQWAGCSVNLLCGREVVLMNVSRNWSRTTAAPEAVCNFTVSDANSEENYEAFCTAVGQLGEKLGRSAEQIDRALVGKGGHRPSYWRDYVTKNRTVAGEMGSVLITAL